METDRTEELKRIAKCVMEMISPYARGVEITYRRETDESVNDFTEWAHERFGIVPGNEYFYVWRPVLLYAVNVTADSVLTAAYELMKLIANKF